MSALLTSTKPYSLFKAESQNHKTRLVGEIEASGGEWLLSSSHKSPLLISPIDTYEDAPKDGD